VAFQYIKGGHKKDRGRLCNKACSDKARGNGFTMKESRFILDTRKKFLMTSVVRHWNWLPREGEDVP